MPMQDAAASALMEFLSARKEQMIEKICRLVKIESPSQDISSQREIFRVLAECLAACRFRVLELSGKKSGGQLLAIPADRRRGAPFQLLLGHSDTVWPAGTLQKMPLRRDGEVLKGPGVYDMKAGLVQMLFAVEALRSLAWSPAVTPVVFINSDEETGSLESVSRIELAARHADRVLIAEPSLGLEGKLKTARRGIGLFRIEVTGKAAHAGLAPEEGVSAILELSHVIQKLFTLNDSEKGISVNVGQVSGGLRPNVIAPLAEAIVDVRVETRQDARWVEQKISGLLPHVEGTRLTIQGGVDRPPMERTLRNRALWEMARRAGSRLGLELEEGTSGGASDGNTTSLHTATLDGLGAVGGGAHAHHEHIRVDHLVERTALLALLLVEPPIGRGSDAGGSQHTGCEKC